MSAEEFLTLAYKKAVKLCWKVGHRRWQTTSKIAMVVITTGRKRLYHYHQPKYFQKDIGVKIANVFFISAIFLMKIYPTRILGYLQLEMKKGNYLPLFL